MTITIEATEGAKGILLECAEDIKEKLKKATEMRERHSRKASSVDEPAPTRELNTMWARQDQDMQRACLDALDVIDEIVKQPIA